LSLPFQFANVTTLVTSQLDANYNALGALVPVVCSASGFNAIVLTPLANNPTISAYANYMLFSYVSGGFNSGPATAQVLGLAALPIYKDVGSGPVPLVENEIVVGCPVLLLYDSALNSGNGGFHLRSDQTTVTTLTNAVSASASIAWPNIPANTSSVSTIPVTGCAVGDCVTLGFPASVPLGIAFFGWVSTLGTVTLQVSNMSGASITPVAGTYRATAQRYVP
jgi:hypothetical protein